MIFHQFARRIVALTRGQAENRARRKHEFQAPSGFYGNDGTKFPKNCLGTLLAKTGKVANTDRFHDAGKLERKVAPKSGSANIAFYLPR